MLRLTRLHRRSVAWASAGWVGKLPVAAAGLDLYLRVCQHVHFIAG